jgi:hypothetical protein
LAETSALDRVAIKPQSKKIPLRQDYWRQSYTKKRALCNFEACRFIFYSPRVQPCSNAGEAQPS